jgi:hypothetical protein
MTEQPVRDPLAFDALLTSSWALYRRNWTVSLPLFIALAIVIAALVVYFAVFFAVALATPSNSTVSPGMLTGFIISYIILIAVLIAASVWAYTATFGMAAAAWERGTASFADGNAAFRSRGGAFIVACIGLFGVAIVALILALPTLLISMLAMLLFTMYVMPAVVAGGRGGFEAIGESFRLVRRFFLPSLITCVVLYGISYGISLIGAIPIVPLELSVMPTTGQTTLHVPPISLIVLGGLGYIVTIVLSLAYTGFYAIAIVGMYRLLVAQPPLPASTPPAPFTSPPAAA